MNCLGCVLFVFDELSRRQVNKKKCFYECKREERCEKFIAENKKIATRSIPMTFEDRINLMRYENEGDTLGT
jgi:hypothetical protein